MAVKKPLAWYGSIKELQSGDTISGGDGSTIPTVVNITSSTYNVTQTSGILIILCNTASNSITINLNTAVGNTTIIDIKKISSDQNSVIIDGNGSETIDGSLTAPIYKPYLSLELVSDNTNWQIV